MNIKLNIERIVLDGAAFSSFRAETVRAAVETQLTNHFANHEFATQAGFHTEQITAPSVGGSTPDQFATDLTASISSILQPGR